MKNVFIMLFLVIGTAALGQSDHSWRIFDLLNLVNGEPPSHAVYLTKDTSITFEVLKFEITGDGEINHELSSEFAKGSTTLKVYTKNKEFYFEMLQQGVMESKFVLKNAKGRENTIRFDINDKGLFTIDKKLTFVKEMSGEIVLIY